MVYLGVELVLYFMTVHTMLSWTHELGVPSDKWFLLFTTALPWLSTVFVATPDVFGAMWIVRVDASCPGDMDAYFEDFVSVYYRTFSTAASIVLNFLADGLMVCARAAVISRLSICD